MINYLIKKQKLNSAQQKKQIKVRSEMEKCQFFDCHTNKNVWINLLLTLSLFLTLQSS